MTNKQQTWSHEDLKIYVLLWCSEADFVQTPTELRFISSRVKGESFDRIYDEFIHDSTEEKIRKIRNFLERNRLSDAEKEEFKKEIHAMFLANDHISASEQELEDYLNKILD